jgi:hypothetical protein
MAVIKPWDTSIPKQQPLLFFADGSGWTCLMIPWLLWTWFWFLGSHGCHQNMWDVHTQATAFTDALMAWVRRLSCFHGCHDLSFHLSSLGKQTHPPLFCSICYFISATSDCYEKVWNHDIVWGHILFIFFCLWCTRCTTEAFVKLHVMSTAPLPCAFQ